MRWTLLLKTMTRWIQFDWGDLCQIWLQVPPCVLCTAHFFVCLSNEPCAYVQRIATHSYMHHPVTVKRSYLLKGRFERVICCLFLMLFMSVHLCGFCMVKPTIALVLKLCFVHTICHTFDMFQYIFVILMLQRLLL
jgi:hypothetical protein